MGKLNSRDRKLAHLAGQNVSNIENRQFATLGTSPNQTLLPGPLAVVPTTGFQTISGTIYWTYIGYTQKTLVVDYVKTVATAAGTGAQTAEIGLASTDAAPAGDAKTLTVLYANGTLDTFVTGTYTNGLVKGNTTAAGFTVSPCVHLWACARFALASSQPALIGVSLDISRGYVLATVTQAALAAGQSRTGALITQGIAATAIAPFLQIQVAV